VRARLGQCRSSLAFRVICDPEMVGHLCRVIGWAGGVVVGREEGDAGVILHIRKADVATPE